MYDNSGGLLSIKWSLFWRQQWRVILYLQLLKLFLLVLVELRNASSVQEKSQRWKLIRWLLSYWFFIISIALIWFLLRNNFMFSHRCPQRARNSNIWCRCVHIILLRIHLFSCCANLFAILLCSMLHLASGGHLEHLYTVVLLSILLQLSCRLLLLRFNDVVPCLLWLLRVVFNVTFHRILDGILAGWCIGGIRYAFRLLVFL